MTGRSYRYILLIGLQKAMSEYFGNARDNFSCCLAMGNLSPEAKRNQKLPGKAPYISDDDMAGLWGHGFTKTKGLIDISLTAVHYD